jgi:hypothetical protein
MLLYAGSPIPTFAEDFIGLFPFAMQVSISAASYVAFESRGTAGSKNASL